ncbi:hypothetical protein GCM10010885_13560 [Alicyclobacillus cellulosilyticus]|uniref:RCK N-terminal domain-containing protein n=1 Tax=Alicyclobacillus cellulosilyticus TaxID=1003997 RepID=A0A917K9I1_9BACL|nr:NAD-binding protein [Alicyclobacillus cellulosilyticus]GGJ05703.1 hypothetical protein GCM10010885_13560 [Alicyclobacillus cellulosilyticus]
MTHLLIAAFGREGLTYAREAERLGWQYRVLACFEDVHSQLSRWHGDKVLHVQGRRADVMRAVAECRFDAAIVQDDEHFIRTALITQSLHDAGVPLIIVVTRDPARRAMYRRCGAHRMVVAADAAAAWPAVLRWLPQVQTA